MAKKLTGLYIHKQSIFGHAQERLTYESVDEQIPRGALSRTSRRWLKNLLTNRRMHEWSKSMVNHLLVDGERDTVLLVTRSVTTSPKQPDIHDVQVTGIVNGEEVGNLTEALWLIDGGSESTTSALVRIQCEEGWEPWEKVVVDLIPEQHLSDKVRDWLGNRRVESHSSFEVKYLFTKREEDAVLLLIHTFSSEYSHHFEGFEVIGIVRGQEVHHDRWSMLDEQGDIIVDLEPSKIIDVEGTTVFFEVLPGNIFSKTLTPTGAG